MPKLYKAYNEERTLKDWSDRLLIREPILRKAARESKPIESLMKYREEVYFNGRLMTPNQKQAEIKRLSGVLHDQLSEVKQVKSETKEDRIEEARRMIQDCFLKMAV